MITSSGIDNHAVSPVVSGPPAANPAYPAAAARPAASAGIPAATCQIPRTAPAMRIEPMTRRGRASGRGSERISATEAPTRITGSSTAPVPMTYRTPASTHSPTGPPASIHDAAATTRAAAMSASAMPSRRCPASISLARLAARVVAPTPRAVADHTEPAALRTAPPEPFRGAPREAPPRAPDPDFARPVDGREDERPDGRDPDARAPEARPFAPPERDAGRVALRAPVDFFAGLEVLDFPAMPLRLVAEAPRHPSATRPGTDPTAAPRPPRQARRAPPLRIGAGQS